MANTSADTRWIDCHALRRDEETRGDGPANSNGLSRYSSGGEREWRGRLRLIEPDGTVIDLSDSVDDAALAKIAAAEKAAAEEARLRAEAEAKAKEEAERKAREEAEAKARAEAEAKAKAEAEEKARKEAEAKAKKEAEEKAKREAAEKARREAEAKAKKEAEEKAKREAAEKARKEAEAKAEKEAEEKAKREAAEKARKEAEAKAKKEAEEKARKEAEAKAKKETEEKAKREAAEKARKEAEAKAKKEAEEKAKREAEEAAAEAKAAEEAKRKAAAEIDLAAAYRRLIPNSGPISLAQYMGESNAKYYASRDPLGDDGDFITAPEVSQMFGELVGLWFADLWVKMGSSKNIHYVELGPGRGTLAQDALRTAGRYGFEPTIHFVEGSPALRDLQAEKFPKAIHHDDLSTLPEDRPLLIVANEFFDALPIKQLLRSADGWYERMIGLEDDALQFVAGKERMDDLVPPSWRNASQGTMIETSPAANAVMEEIATRLTNQGGAALVIDYGPLEARAGSTLQALKNHVSVDPLTHPGEADITAHVDFERLSQVAKENGAEVMGLQMQGEWLHQMGIDTRLEALKRKNPNDEEVLQRQYDRLMRDDQMGTLFKVLGLCGRRWPIGAGFE
ncbi:MAG: SAM-dependent methyltransferase [Pseudomonadota bacterium]